jgi:hypothetical protein
MNNKVKRLLLKKEIEAYFKAFVLRDRELTILLDVIAYTCKKRRISIGNK